MSSQYHPPPPSASAGAGIAISTPTPQRMYPAPPTATATTTTTTYAPPPPPHTPPHYAPPASAPATKTTFYPPPPSMASPPKSPQGPLTSYPVPQPFAAQRVYPPPPSASATPPSPPVAASPPAPSPAPATSRATYTPPFIQPIPSASPVPASTPVPPSTLAPAPVLNASTTTASIAAAPMAMQFAPPPTEAMAPAEPSGPSTAPAPAPTPVAVGSSPPVPATDNTTSLPPTSASAKTLVASAASDIRRVFASSRKAVAEATSSNATNMSTPTTASTPPTAPSVPEKSMPTSSGPADSLGGFSGAHSVSDDTGIFNGGSFRISHRDCNSILTIQLAFGAPLIARPGAMIAMSHSVSLKGTASFSLKKYVAGGEVGHSTYSGPGEVLLAPAMLGDLITLRLSGSETWSLARDAFLACTQGVKKDYKRQGLSKAIFSGEGLFVYKISGTGLLWITSFGAVIRKELQDGEKYFVDNGHLVAWNTKYVMERVASGGIISGLASGEGLVCKFTGPGTVYIQTRNPRTFSAYMAGQQYQG
ncbi:hypothetical protein CFIMG_002964RA [Ceratocystis fimbriata CBS 114723]|uniref:Altered inheritance of mitochondria protein 24, mitochondrial n=1 Tax=Ceratocystis fimbriata CBS 114723 TaxID=1035309 RepID=A0A2C5X7M4_9PEZI|nr:hypothetical protein CFIMG_002964RA [Ceratocystis fimbriata CBS 114723]